MQEVSALLRSTIAAVVWVQASVTTVAQLLEHLRTPAPLPTLLLLDSVPFPIPLLDQETSTKAPMDSRVARA